MKKIYIAIAATTAIAQMAQATYLNDSWGFKDFESQKIYSIDTLSVKAINNAIDKAHNNGGGTVIIPAGELHANNPIIIKDNVKLKGSTRNSKNLTYIDANFDMASGKRALIISYHTTNTTIENLNLDLKGHNLTAISYAEGNQHNFLIANNNIKNVGFVKYEVAKAKGTLPHGHTPVDGISLHDWGTNDYSTEFTIKNNYIESYSEHGVNLHYVKKFIIDHNTMKNGMMGVDISTGSEEGEILNNDFSNVVAGAKIIGNRSTDEQEIYFHNNYSHDNPKTIYYDDVSEERYDDGGRGLERQFKGKGIHIYDNILKGHSQKYDMLYFNGAFKFQDDLHGNNDIKNPILYKEPIVKSKLKLPSPIQTPPKEIVAKENTKLKIKNKKSSVVFSITGEIEDSSHIQFFIDSDNNPLTGFSNGKVKGADYAIEDDHLMKSTENSSNWKWKVVQWGLKTEQNRKKASATLNHATYNLMNSEEISVIGSTINSKWQRKTRKYYGSNKFQMNTNVFKEKQKIKLKPQPKAEPTVTAELKSLKYQDSKAYIPDLNFNEIDVYKNWQVSYVQNSDELQYAISSAKPNTTIILKDGSYTNLNIIFPKGKHHITVKAQNKHQAIITPRGNNDEAAFYLPATKSKNEINHHINFIDLEVSGGGQFIRSPDASFLNAHHVYFRGVKMHNLWMGLYSGLSSHDWTVDGCEFYNSEASYMWYMMGYHHAVINSVMYNNSYFSLSIRGCYPLNEKFYYYNKENNIRISERKTHFLKHDDWTHLIANNTFGSNYNNNRLQDAHIALYYNSDEGYKESEDVYFPPKNVMIFNNVFVDRGNGSKKMLSLMAKRGVNSSKVTSVNGLFIKNNYIDKSTLIDADTDILSVDLSSNHTGILEDKFAFDDTNRDYFISNESILKDSGILEPVASSVDFRGNPRDNKIDVGAFEAK